MGSKISRPCSPALDNSTLPSFDSWPTRPSALPFLPHNLRLQNSHRSRSRAFVLLQFQSPNPCVSHIRRSTPTSRQTPGNSPRIPAPASSPSILLCTWTVSSLSIGPTPSSASSRYLVSSPAREIDSRKPSRAFLDFPKPAKPF